MSGFFVDAIPLVASLISLLFTWKLLRQFSQKKNRSLLMWGMSMLLYAIAAFGEFYGLTFGMNVVLYKLYYISAVSLVAIMAAGQVYFLSQKWGHWFLGIVGIGLITFLIHTLVAPIDLEALPKAGTIVGGQAMPTSIRKIYPPILSGIGGTVLMVGAAWSWWKTRKRSPLMITVGALVLTAAGRLATLGYPEWLPLSELLGITIMYYGFIGNRQISSQSASTTV